MYSKVLVFGPTGGVASVVALTAAQNGSKVYLAMRKPEKSIPGLTKEAEAAGEYERIQADLTQPESVLAAAKQSGAKSAFIYLAHGASDHMRGTIEALKKGDVQFVVFLSSFTVQGDIANIPPQEIVPWSHGQVELVLQDVFGENFVAIRPAVFATNAFMWKSGIQAGELKIQFPDGKFDMVTPDDMGKVSGAVLSKGKQNGEQEVYLFGPQLIAERDAAAVIGKAIGKDVKIVTMNKEEGAQHYAAQGMPPAVAAYLAGKYDDMVKSGAETSIPREFYDANVGNVERYTGKPGLKFEDWVEANKEAFAAA